MKTLIPLALIAFAQSALAASPTCCRSGRSGWNWHAISPRAARNSPESMPDLMLMPALRSAITSVWRAARVSRSAACTLPARSRKVEERLEFAM
jgi:hypothetical protein